MAAQLFRDAAAEVENPVFHEGEWARNGLRHGLRLQAVAKSWSKTKGIAELMPYAKGVSAKSHNFDENGNETKSDFLKIMKIVKKSGFKGYVGIEYEGNELSEDDGIKATKALLERVFAEL